MSGANLIERHAGAFGIAVFLSVWELCARLVWRDPQVLPGPSEALIVSLGLLAPAEIAGHVATSLGRILAGFSIAAVAGTVLGIACGWSRLASTLIRPFVEILRPIPPLAWIPIAIVWFGLGEASKVFVIVLGAFFPVFTAAWRGTTLIPPVLIRAARGMDVSGPGLLWRVAVPAILPDLASGLRIGFGLAFGILVAAELIAADRGMGHLVMEARQLGRLPVAVFGIVLIGIVNLLADFALAAIIRRTIGRWSRI